MAGGVLSALYLASYLTSVTRAEQVGVRRGFDVWVVGFSVASRRSREGSSVGISSVRHGSAGLPCPC